MSQDLAKQQRTLFDIADDFQTYFETLAFAEAQLEASSDVSERQALEDGRAEIMAQITRVGAELATKADRVAGVIRRMKSEIELLSAEEMRLCQRRLVVERSEKWLRDYVISVMRATEQRSIRTPTVTLRIQANGGKLPVVVTQPEEVPDNCKWLSITVRLDIWNRFQRECEEMAESMRVALSRLMSNMAHTSIEPSLTLIGETLQKPCTAIVAGLPCTAGRIPHEGPQEDWPLCAECHGTGKQKVPGAHLGDRGEHLRIG